MRVHISLDPRIVKELDRRAGPRRRSSFIARSLEQALEDERRWELIMSALGTVRDERHEWDADPAAWVRAQRRADRRRTG